jgi:hypothetical protein
MDKKIQKLLDKKYENLVQFNVTNATSNPIFLDLFNTSDLAVIPTSPTYIYPPNSLVGTTTTTMSPIFCAINSIGYLYVSDNSSSIEVYDTNNNNVLVSVIPLGIYSAGFLIYNPINDFIYVNDNGNNLLLIDCNFNTLTSVIVMPSSCTMSALNSINNTLYLTSTVGSLYVVDCSTQSLLTTIALNCIYVTYNSINNLIYTTDNFPNLVIVNCNTNTIIGNIILSNPSDLIYNQSNNCLYISNNFNTEIAVVNCNTNTLLSSTPISITSGTLITPVIDTNLNNVYWGTLSGRCIEFNTINNVITNDFSVGIFPLAYGVYNDLQKSLYFTPKFTNFFYQITTIGVTASPYYISGSSNYNAFVNNLNSEPVQIQMIRLLVQNQEQLYNQFQLTKIDSNGNQIFLPDFPINKIDINQEQGNISEIELKDVVFDGRTYINQYQLNPYESLSFEIYYIQLDLTTATSTYPIFFKPKIQLKEYIKKELNL